jgi:hypothetical protein
MTPDSTPHIRSPLTRRFVLVLESGHAEWRWGGFENVDRSEEGSVVPKGLSDGSQAIYCLEGLQGESVP